MAKVLRIINRLNLGGPTYNASYLTKYLSPDYETLLVAGMKDSSEASSNFIPESMGIKAVTISSMKRSLNPFKDVQAYNEIKKLIKEYQPDIVHTHAAKAGALGRLAAHSMKVPVILHTFHGHIFHSYFNRLKTELFLKIERNLAGKSSKIIAISNLQQKELQDEFKIANREKFEVIPLGFELNRFQENYEEKRNTFRNIYHLDDDEIAIGIIGRIVPIKNHRLFLNVLDKARNHSTKKLRFFIIGDGEETDVIKQYASDLKIDWSDKTDGKSLLTFTSWIKNIDVANAGLDIVTLTSLNEGTPVSLIEAQAANKPIVSTNVGGVEDIIIPGETGLLCRSNSEDDFTAALLQLIEDDDLRHNMGKKGFEHVSKQYSYKRLVVDMKQLYDKLLKEKS